MIISWNTEKTADGFNFRVYQILALSEANEFGSYANVIPLKSGTCPTRARAKGCAIRWVRFFKQ